MAALSTQLAFDYGDMPAADAKALEKHAESVLKIQERWRRTNVENALQLGGELAAAQTRLSNHGNGTFGKWCKERLAIAKPTAYLYISLHEGVPEKDRLIVGQTFDVVALRDLLKDTAPEEAYRDALKLAKKGEPVTAKAARELLAKYTVDAAETDDGDEDDEPLSGEFDPASAIDSARSFIKNTFERWPKEKRKLLLAQLRQLVNELDDPNLINAETLA